MGKEFDNFICKYSDLPNNFENIGLIIDEFKNIKNNSILSNLKKRINLF